MRDTTKFSSLTETVLPCDDSPVLEDGRHLCEDKLQNVPVSLLAQALDHETTGASQCDVVDQWLLKIYRNLPGVIVEL